MLVNNAGVGDQGKLFLDQTYEDWDRVLGVGLTGTANCNRAVLEHMIKQKEGKIQDDSWEVGFRDLRSCLSESEEYTPAEMAIVVASRRLQEKVREYEYQNILCGAGMANLAGWMAYYQLREEGIDLDIMAEAGMFGYAPRPGDPTTFNTRNFPSCKMLTDLHHVMGMFAGGGRNSCIGSLGAGQIDRFGNINSSKVAEKGIYMVGSGGANDISSSAQEAVVTAIQRPGTFVTEVPYITSPGKRVTTLISTMGVFEKHEEGKELVLTGLFPNPGCRGEDETVRYIKEQCGWELQVARELVWVNPPSVEERMLIRIFDPERKFLGKL